MTLFRKKCVGLLQSSHHCRHTVEAESPPEALTPQRRMIWEKIKPCNASAVISVYTIAYEKRTKRTKRTNFQFSSKNLWYSILTLSFRCLPSHLHSYLTPRQTIEVPVSDDPLHPGTGIVLSQASTWLLICAAAAFRSSRISSSRSSCPGFSSTEWAMP